MIIEGIVTSWGTTGELNVAPMGPIVDADFTSLILRPFPTSQTCRNLRAHPCGVFHVVDDVLLLAHAALDRLPSLPATAPAQVIQGSVLENCCRWYEFEVTACDTQSERTRMEARVVFTGRRRDFFGFNRAKHAVLEATILATRLHLLPKDEIQTELRRLQPLVDKTAGETEFAAWDFVQTYIADWQPAEQPLT